MIIVYQENGRYTTPKNIIIDYIDTSQFNFDETKYLNYIKETVRNHIWKNIHISEAYQYKNDVNNYPLPTIINIIKM